MATRCCYQCERCGRKLKQDRWVYSSWTKNRYCWPGEGCNKGQTRKARKRAA